MTNEEENAKKINEFLLIDWISISIYQTLPEEFIREFKDEVNWKCISAFQILSGEFIEEFRCEVSFKNLSSQSWINYLKYKRKNNKITNEEYLKELIKCRNQSQN